MKFTQVRLSKLVVLMRDINQKPSNTDKQIAIASRRSVWLNYLLTFSTISAGGLSIQALTALLGTKPAQANTNEQAANLPAPTAAEELFKHDAELKLSQTPGEQTTLALTSLALTASSIAKLPVFTAGNLSQGTEFNFVPTAVTPVFNSDHGNLPETWAVGDKPTTVLPTFVLSATAVTPTLPALTPEMPGQLALENEPTPEAAPNPVPIAIASTPEPAQNPIPTKIASTPEPAPTPVATAAESTVYKSPGSAALLGGTLQAQSSRENPQQPPPSLQNTPQKNDALAPSLVFQGVYLYQGDSSARARLTGIYPVSPNALFGGTAEIGTGPDFSDPQAGAFRINELYFTGNLPSLPNLRLTAGLVDLTSYFDRNSFAKDAATHFFNPVFQTNPALSATGIGSRPAVLLNWNITDNIEAKAAGFSSAESILDFGLDAFAGELGFRFGNGIIRATYATDRDVDRNGFKEIYGIQRNPGEFGPRSSDRESSYGINGEYFIPELKMGLFGRYGRYENTSIGRGGDTYSLGVSFLDLFMRDDRLGFGYGRNLSNDDLRRQTGAKVPDVWELFYDIRLSPILRAAVSLQERDQFTDTVFGFRIKTEFDVTSLLGRLFR